MADLDILGHKVSPLAATAIGGGSLAVIWLAWKQHQASSTSSSAIDPVTGLPASQDSAIDPLTGMAYLAEAQEFGSVAAAEQATAGESAVDLSSGFGDGFGGSGSGTSTGTLVPGNEVQAATYASNAAWAQAVEAGLTDIGYSSTDVAAALGRYLGGLSETSAQAGITRAAIAEYGPPPVGSFQVIMAPPPGAATGGSAVPKTAPSPASVTPHPGYADFGWGQVAGATSYQYEANGPARTEEQVAGTHAEHVTLAPGKYQWRVRAAGGGGYGPWSAWHAFTVPAAPKK